MSFIVVAMMYVHHLGKINLSKVVALLIFHLQLPACGQFSQEKKKKKNQTGASAVKSSA